MVMTEATLTTMYKCFCLSREKHLCGGSCCGILLAVPTFHLAIPGEQMTVTPRKHLCSTHSSHCKGTEKLIWYCFMAMYQLYQFCTWIFLIKDQLCICWTFSWPSALPLNTACAQNLGKDQVSLLPYQVLLWLIFWLWEICLFLEWPY